MIRRTAAIALLALASACSGPPRQENQGLPVWPGDLAARAYYVDAWRGDEPNAAVQSLPEYLNCVLDFYDGSLLAPGWRRAQASLLRDADPRDRAVFEPELACLGQILSAEWSKDNSVRRIDSARLMSIAGRVRRAAKEGSLRETVEGLIHDAGDRIMREASQ